MIKLLQHISFLILPLSLFGQHYPHDVPDYDFIDYDQNQITFFNDSSNFQSFYSKLDSNNKNNRDHKNISNHNRRISFINDNNRRPNEQVTQCVGSSISQKYFT